MENKPFIDGLPGLPINSMVIFHGYVSHNQMVAKKLWVHGSYETRASARNRICAQPGGNADKERWGSWWGLLFNVASGDVKIAIENGNL